MNALKMATVSILFTIGMCVAVTAHAQDTQDMQTIRIDANTAMVCGAPRDMSAGSGKVRDCRMVRLEGKVVKTAKGGK